MSSRVWFGLSVLCIMLLLCTQIAFSRNQDVRVERLQTNVARTLAPKDLPVRLSASDSCDVYMGTDPAYLIYPWVEGDELFKAYQNPAATCSNPYPFAIDRVHFIFYMAAAGSFVLSADIELVDNTDPTCPHPGNMLTLTDGYSYEVADADLYMVTIPLDSPIVVNGPYFVGLYIGSDGTPSNIAVVTDDVPVGCASYNDWGYGYVDLDTVYTDPDGTGYIKTFPGRMLLFSSGTVGGSSGGETEPAPAAEFIKPINGEFIGGSIDLWANDAAGSSIIERADFYYSYGGSWTFIGNDMSDDPPLRNTQTASGSGNGLSYNWYPSGLSEGAYQLRAILTDTLGRADTADISVYLDPTPPFPTITNPTTGEDVCDGIQASMTVPDEDIGYFTFEMKSIESTVVRSVPMINQNLGGDTNGNTADGNLASNGEYGDYCSGPAAASMAVKYWANSGYSTIITEGVSTLTDAQIIERFFTGMQVADNLGTYDEEFVAGLRNYIIAHGGGFRVSVNRDPLVKNLYNQGFNDEMILMAGLSGNPGRWLVITGITGLNVPDSLHIFKFADPAYGAAADYYVKEDLGKLWVEYFGQWYEIDVLVGLVPTNWSAGRTSIGFDGNGSDGWGFFWNTASLNDAQHHFLYATAFDNSSHSGSDAVLVKNTCTGSSSVPGDVNDDGNVNPGDLVYLINYLFLNEAAPPAGIGAANINDDNTIDIRDVMYLYRYLFLGGPAPM
ncbi:MAG: dockerin type I repeat-containing protein [Candidatus Zixiibacteriota bacterium]